MWLSPAWLSDFVCGASRAAVNAVVPEWHSLSSLGRPPRGAPSELSDRGPLIHHYRFSPAKVGRIRDKVGREREVLGKGDGAQFAGRPVDWSCLAEFESSEAEDPEQAQSFFDEMARASMLEHGDARCDVHGD